MIERWQQTWGAEFLDELPLHPLAHVSSLVHKRGELRWDDLDLTQDFSGHVAYAQSKLAVVVFTAELARRLGGDGPIVVSLHPGVVTTKLLVDGFQMEGRDSLDDGAATSIYLALLPGDELRPDTGAYFKRKKVAEVNPVALDPSIGARLYEHTCELLELDALPARA